MKIGFLASLALALALVLALFALKPPIDRDKLADGDRASIASAATSLDAYPFTALSSRLHSLSHVWSETNAKLHTFGDARGEGAWFADGAAIMDGQITLLAIAALGSTALFWLGLLAQDRMVPSGPRSRLVGLCVIGAIALPIWACEGAGGLVFLVPWVIGLCVAMAAKRRAESRGRRPRASTQINAHRPDGQ